MAAKLVLRKCRRDSATDCLKTLHWLPVSLRIDFKLLTIVWKCLKGQSPPYLAELLDQESITRTLRSSSQRQLKIPKTKCKTFGDRAFAVAGVLQDRVSGILCQKTFADAQPSNNLKKN